MRSRTDHWQQRNREVGRILREARQRNGRTVTECAMLLRTSRRRYTAIEEGTVAIQLIELEDLMAYLGISAYTLWKPDASIEAQPATQTIVVTAQPGHVVQLVLEIREESHT